jgi:KH domain
MSQEDTSKRERDENDELLLVQDGVDPCAKRFKTDFDDSSTNHGIVDIVEAQSTPIVSEASIEPEKLVDITAEQLVNKEQYNDLQKETLATQATCAAQPETPQPDLKPATHANCCRAEEEISGVELPQVPAVSSVDPVANSTFTLPHVEPNVSKPVNPSVAATVTNPNSIVEERGEISAQYVGKVIGKGGEMLRDLQARSGCRLDVDQNVPHGNPRILTYRGTRKKVDLAKQMVRITLPSCY